MGKSERNPSSEKVKNPSGLVWANIYLDGSQKEAAKLFAADPDKTMSCWETLLSDGYSVSFGFNEETDSFICTVVGKSCIEDNRGVGMTTHAGSILAALQRALYKHFVVCESGSWLAIAESQSRPLT